MSNKYEKDFEKFKKNISKLQNDKENIDKITKLLEKQLLSQQEYKYYLKCKKYAEDVDLKKHKIIVADVFNLIEGVNKKKYEKERMEIKCTSCVGNDPGAELEWKLDGGYNNNIYGLKLIDLDDIYIEIIEGLETNNDITHNGKFYLDVFCEK